MRDEAMETTTLDHQRAKYALDKVTPIAEKKDEVAKKFRSYAESLPAIIVRNGLGQALAMEAANGKVGQSPTKDDEKAHKALYDMVGEWLLQQVFNKKVADNIPLQVINEIITADQMTYMRAQEEAIHFLQWVKRFANAMIERPDT